MKVSLFRLALGAWVAWLLTLGVTAWLSFRGKFHPSCLYMAVPLAVQLVCTAALIVGGLWRVVRGPTRFRAATWVLVGLLPTLWMAAYVEYLIRFAAGRNHPQLVLVRAGAAIAELVAEPYVRLFHPYRHEGRRFVMWSDSPEASQSVMKAMDDHILAMEKSLGGQSPYKVYWVRGDVIGIGGRYTSGWSLGSPAPPPGRKETSLDWIDRHEVAHFALDQLLLPYHEAPSLLNEGWAELHTNDATLREASRRCWVAQQRGRLSTLRELTCPASYHHSDTPMYDQGCVLVDYLLRRFGHAKFVEFCRTCRQATFDDDLRRVFGMGLDELDAAYREDLLQGQSPEELILATLPRNDQVDAKQWSQFTADYLASMKRLCAAMCPATIEVLNSWRHKDKAGGETIQRERFQYYVDRGRWALIETNEHRGYQLAQLRLPRVWVTAFRKNEQPWELRECRACQSADIDAATTKGLSAYHRFGAYLDPLQLLWTGELHYPVITGLGPSPTNGQLVRVSFEGRLISAENQAVSGWWDVDPAHDYSLVSGQVDFLDARGKLEKTDRTTVEYSVMDGRRTPPSGHREIRDGAGHAIHELTSEITSCRFGPPPPEVFEASSYGNLCFEPRPEPASVAPSVAAVAVSYIGPLTWIATGASVLAASCGVILWFRSRRQDRAIPTPDVPAAD